MLFKTMASDISGRFILRMCVIVLATSLNNSRVSNTMLAVAEILIEPLWDRASNTSQCHVDTSTAGGFYLKGSATETCSLKVNLFQGNHLQLQIPRRNTSQKPPFIYIKRDGDRENCLNKYIAFGEQNETCNSTIIDKNIQVVLQGNASVLIRNMPTAETSLKCPEENDYMRNTKDVSQSLHCINVKKV